MTNEFFHPDLLRDRVALITGGGSGICKGIALAYARYGAQTVLVGRTPEKLDAAAAEIRQQTGQPSFGFAADVRDYDAVAGVVARTVDEVGPIDILINGAAGNFLAPAAKLSSNGFRTVLDIDAVGTFNVSRAVFEKTMGERGGAIINISATLHYGATHLQVHAASAKAAVDATTRSMALEWGPAGVRVNGIAPGGIEDTEGMTRLLPPDMKARIIAAIPMRRFGKIDEIANVALFLASGAASLISGAIIVADGGACLPAASGVAASL